MIELLALGAAAVFGSADFFGGLTARRANTVATVFMSQFAGLILLLIALPFLPAANPLPSDWKWGVIAGLSGGIGVALLYRALAVGTMAVVAPITAVCAAMIPVIAAFILGERLRISAVAGIAVAFVAIALVSQSPNQSDAETNITPNSKSSASLILALLAGVIIGLFFLSLARTSSQSGMWPLVTARITSIVLFGFFALALGRTLRMDTKATVTASAGGGLDMLANILYMLAARIGPLSIVVTLASLYPAATVVLARVVLHERLSWVQAVGIGCALVAVVLIVAPGF